MACSGNLGDRAQNARLRMSLVFLALGLGLAVLLIRTDAAAGYRALLFVPFFGAAFGAYQGLFRTCTYAAKHGVRLTDEGEERMANPADLARVRKSGRAVILSSFLTAVMATLVIVLIP